MRTRASAVLAAAVMAIIVAPGQLFAQDEWKARIHEYLDRVSAPALENGFAALGDELTGALAAGESGSIDLNLNAGTEYSLIGVCDDDCSDMDLELHDAAGREVDSDLEFDDVPVISATPDQAAAYRLTIGMVRCETDPCYYGIRLLGRPATEPDEHHDIVRRQLDGFAAELAKQGYQRTHGFRISALDQAGKAEFVVRLKAGTTYAIGGFCDDDCSDLDLAVFTDGADPAVQDVLADDHPAVDLEVTSTGVFRVRVTMASCANQPCVWGVGLSGRPTGTPPIDASGASPGWPGPSSHHAPSS